VELSAEAFAKGGDRDEQIARGFDALLQKKIITDLQVVRQGNKSHRIRD
jgi:hypothetical protein